MKLTAKQIQVLVAMVETMETNFSLDLPFHENADEGDFFNWANEDDIRNKFQGKSISGIMSHLIKKGILLKDYSYETKWVKVRRAVVLKQIEHSLYCFASKDLFAEVFGIKEGESARTAMNRLMETV